MAQRYLIGAVVTLYTALTFLLGDKGDVPGTDAESLAWLALNRTWEPYRYYGHLFYLVLQPQVYYYLTPAIVMIPAAFLGLRRWFLVWVVVLFGSAGYIHHMLSGSFLPIINYMVFIPMNLYLLNRYLLRQHGWQSHPHWLIVSMLASLMFHGSSGIIIQAGTLMCMAARFGVRDWGKVAPLAAAAASLYALNHYFAPSLASQAVLTLGSEDNGYASYLGVIRAGGVLSRYDWGNVLGINWALFYFGLPVIPAMLLVAFRAKALYIRQLACFTVLPIGVIIGWFAMPELHPYTFDILDRASNALSIIIFMGAGLALADLLERDHT